MAKNLIIAKSTQIRQLIALFYRCDLARLFPLSKLTRTNFCGTGENELALFLILPYLLIDLCTGVDSLLVVGVEDCNGTVVVCIVLLVFWWCLPLFLLVEAVCLCLRISWSTTSCISSPDDSESDETSNKSSNLLAVVPVSKTFC